MTAHPTVSYSNQQNDVYAKDTSLDGKQRVKNAEYLVGGLPD